MPDRLAGVQRYMWPERGTAEAVCKADLGAPCGFFVEKVNYETAAGRARQHTRETGHDTRVYHRRIVEYSLEGSDA
jgi:hypothetical protein